MTTITVITNTITASDEGNNEVTNSNGRKSNEGDANNAIRDQYSDAAKFK